MKLAICLSGKFCGKNPRGEKQEFRIPCFFLKKNIIADQVDVFIHGWDDDPEESKELIKFYQPKKHLLEKQITFNHPYKNYNFVPSGPWATNKCIDIHYSRFYSLKKSVEMVDDSYDMILISRFDTVFYEKFDVNKLNKEDFYISHWDALKDGYGFNDGWFLSSTKNIKSLAKIYDRLDEYLDLQGDYLKFLKSYQLDERNFGSGHTLWKYRTHEMGINFVSAIGNEYDTWGLVRRFNQRRHPLGFSPPNIDSPTKIDNRLHKLKG